MKKLPSNPLPFSILLLISPLICSLTLFSSAQPSFWFYHCANLGNYTINTTFAANLNTFLSAVPHAQFSGGINFYNLTAGETSTADSVTGTGLCPPYLPGSDCRSCFADAALEIRQVCPNQKEAIGWYRDCVIRYSNRSILGVMETSPRYCSSVSPNASDPEAFDEQVRELLRSLQLKAAAGDSRRSTAAGSRKISGSVTIYAEFSCTADLKDSDCAKCVEEGIDYIADSKCCPGRQGCNVLSPSCDFRFDVVQFYHLSDDSPPTPLSPMPTAKKGISRQKRHSGKLLGISIGIPTLTAMVLLAVGILICRRRKKSDSQTSYGDAEEIIGADSLQFDFNTIKIATCNFSPDNKLGEGGFGVVYKGKLGCGQEIAVKRLSKNSTQGISEFQNEVLLVAKLQHKNLVKLLGFCLASEEKILVYEFLPNSSLDQFLFDPMKSASLNWGARFKIISGIARGLLYLHEDSRLKIVHRDLKTSNILLDEFMNPKISDFGIAKLFGVDQTQGDTNRIVGTYGYMAPEYAIAGHFSVKSDVYSFGVIILEIVSGQKSRYFFQSDVEEALLYRAWRLWKENQLLELVDPTLNYMEDIEEITKCIHIGLLSMQEDPTQRLRMTSIIAALNGESIKLPEPKAPQFLSNTRALGSEIDESKTTSSSIATTSITNMCPR